MDSRIDDEMLGRLVAHEGYVESLFAQAARRRWLDMNVDVATDYEQLKILKKQISYLVDRAFCRYGVAKGVMRLDRANLGADLDEDLEALAAQLQKMQWREPDQETDKPLAAIC